MNAGPDPALAAAVESDYERTLRNMLAHGLAQDHAESIARRYALGELDDGPPENVILPPSEALQALDLEEADKASPPAREFVLEPWLPRGETALFAGGGGFGKTLAVQQIAMSSVVGEPIFGIPTRQGPALLFLCEEDVNEVWRRALRIAQRAGRKLVDYQGLHLIPRAGQDNTLVSFVGGVAVAEKLLQTIEAYAIAVGATLIVLDNVAHLFGGNENDRHQVTVFGSMMTRLAKTTDAAVVLVAHPGKSPVGATAEYSGSTAWEAIVRARLWLERPPKGGDDEDPEYMILRRQKANYAPGTAKVEIVNVGGVFELRDAGQAQRASAERVAAARAAIVEALQALGRMGVHVSHSPRAGNFVLKVGRDLGHLAGHREDVLREALSGLMADGELVANAPLGKGADRHPIRGLSLVGSQQRLDDAR